MRRSLALAAAGVACLTVSVWGFASGPPSDAHASAPHSTPRPVDWAGTSALVQHTRPPAPPTTTTTSAPPAPVAPVTSTTSPAPAPAPAPAPVTTTTSPPPVYAPAAPTGPQGVETVPGWQVWELVAQCETGGNWQARGPIYSGGLGMTNANWAAFGGQQYAWTAATATPAEQMTVANRVEPPPWTDTPAGGCHGW